MKRKTLIIIFILHASIQFKASSQLLDTINPDKKVYFGIHAAMSFFGPSGVNNYLENLYSGYSFEQGFPDIIMNFTGRLDLSYVMTDYVDITGLLELSLAPKFITVNYSQTDFYCFTRFSPGGMFNFYFKPGRTDNYFLGAGALLNFMVFEDFSGVSPGLRLQFGKSATLSNINAKASLVINIMPPANANGIDLNYSDIGFSMGFCF